MGEVLKLSYRVRGTTLQSAPDHGLIFQVKVFHTFQVVPFSLRKVDIRLPGKGNSKSHGTRPFYYNHLDDPVDSDQ